MTAIFVLFASASSAYTLKDTENFTFSLDSCLRTDSVTFKNVVDLDSSQSDDTTTFLALDYSLGFQLASKDEGFEFFIRLERNGPFDYGAPLFIHNTLITNGGAVERYRHEDLLPELEEFWLDLPIWGGARLKSGLYTHKVGNGYSLSGGYENLGFTIYRESDNYNWRLYYCRPDFARKNPLGPRVTQDVEQGVLYEDNVANFFAADIYLGGKDYYYQPYIGVLADNTSEGKRSNFFTAPVKRDILGTLGLACGWKQDNWSFDLEAAHNFGRAKSGDSAYEDIYHSGYLIYAGLDYTLGKFNPMLQFLVCSGNKTTPEMAEAEDTTLASGRNRAFSYESPFNDNLGDSISSCNVDMLPIVAMGGGYGLNYGVRRPRTFAPGDFDNLLMPNLGFDFNLSDKLVLSLYGYYLMSFERGVATLNGTGRYLSRDLGAEFDFYIDYQFNDNILISFLGGCFFPGQYYREERDDTDGSIFSPYLRGDKDADSAYQVELSIQYSF